MDPEKQQKVRDRLNELSAWARNTAQDVAGAVEEAASKAQSAFQRAADRMTGSSEPAPAAEPAQARASTPPRKRKPAAKKKGKAKPKSKAKPKARKSGGKKRKR